MGSPLFPPSIPSPRSWILDFRVCSSAGQSTRLISVGSLVQIQPDPPRFVGGVAQLGERLLCKQEVIGSIPFTSTTGFRRAKSSREPRKNTAGSR